MKIRAATSKDIDAISRLNDQIADYHHENEPDIFLPSNPANRDFLTKVFENPEIHFMVAEELDQIVGFVSTNVTCNTETPFLTNAPICRIKTIVVDENHRSAGVGAALAEAVQGWAREKGAREIRLEVMEFNRRALSFYERLGYTTQSRIMALKLAD